jgi:hypothetical protein
MDFFKGYNNIRCNHDEFKILKGYLWKDGWSWYSNPDDYNPYDLALISIRGPLVRAQVGPQSPISDKKIIPYFLDEIEYILPDKDVKEIIREIKLKELGI